jgi:hypothetical protein
LLTAMHRIVAFVEKLLVNLLDDYVKFTADV